MRAGASADSTPSLALLQNGNGKAAHVRTSGGPGNGSSASAPRSLPFSEDGEKGVVCSLLLSPREVGDACVLNLTPDAFYIPAHQIIISAQRNIGTSTSQFFFPDSSEVDCLVRDQFETLRSLRHDVRRAAKAFQQGEILKIDAVGVGIGYTSSNTFN